MNVSNTHLHIIMIISIFFLEPLSVTLFGKTPLKNNIATGNVQFIIKVQKTHQSHLDKILNDEKAKPQVTLELKIGRKREISNRADFISTTKEHNIYKIEFTNIILNKPYKLTVRFIHGYKGNFFKPYIRRNITYTQSTSTETIVFDNPRLCKIDVHLLTLIPDAQFIAYCIPDAQKGNDFDSSFIVADRSNDRKFSFSYWKARNGKLVLKRFTGDNQIPLKPIPFRPEYDLAANEHFSVSGTEYFPFDKISLISKNCDN